MALTIVGIRTTYTFCTLGSRDERLSNWERRNPQTGQRFCSNLALNRDLRSRQTRGSPPLVFLSKLHKRFYSLRVNTITCVNPLTTVLPLALSNQSHTDVSESRCMFFFLVFFFIKKKVFSCRHPPTLRWVQGFSSTGHFRRGWGDVASLKI